MPDFACRVLVADDDPLNRLVAAESLQALGVDVLVATTGREALDALGGRPVDLLLLDVHMPDMSGIEAALRIRALEQSHGARRVPIVALTASATIKDRQACLDAGMDEVLTKPFRLEQLDALLQRWCRP